MVISGMVFWVVVLGISYTVTIGTLHLNGKLEKRIVKLENRLKQEMGKVRNLQGRIDKIRDLEKQNPRTEPAWGTVPSDEPSRNDLRADSIIARFTPSMNGVTVDKYVTPAITFAQAERYAYDRFDKVYGKRFIPSTLKCVNVRTPPDISYSRNHLSIGERGMSLFEFSAAVIDE